MMKTTRLIPSLALLAVLTACSKKDSAEHYADAQNFLANKQYNAAIIELRSAVRQSPEDARFRLALGLVLLETGEIVQAERELQRALDYGAADEDVAFPLIKANYLLSNHSAVLSLLAGSTELSARTEALLNTYRVLSELELGDTPAAMLLLETLADSSENDVQAFAKALRELSQQNSDAAMTQLLTIASNSELYAEAVFLQSKVQLANRDTAAATASLNHYLELVPSANLARLFLAQAYVQNEQFVEAEPHLTLLLQQFPDQPLANFLQSIIFFKAENFESAKSHSEKALRDPGLSTRARIIAAISSMQLNLDAQALTHLDTVKDQLHQFPDAQRLYAMLQLRSGETEQAREILATLPDNEKNLQLIATTAFELVRQGAADSAQDLINQYEQQSSRDVTSLTTLGSIKLGIEGQREAGIRDLQQALELDPTVNRTRLVLAFTYLQLKEFDKAADLADEWLKDPEMAVAGYSLKAYAKMLQQQFTEALQFADQALQLKPQSPFPTLVQAMIVARNGDLDSSLKQLSSMLDQHPQYLAGLEQYYALSKTNKNSDDATKRIERLFKENEQLYPARLLRARVAHDQQDFQKVVALLSSVSIPAQDLPPVHNLVLIESQHKLGHSDAALKLAEQWYSNSPQSIEAGYTYANALSANNDFDKALTVINSLLTSHSNQPRLVMAQLGLLRQLNRLDQAIAVINNLPQATLASPQVQFMKGRLALENGNTSDALKAFENSYGMLPAHETAMYIALNMAPRSEDSAKAFIEQHIKQHGSDSALDTYFATLLLKTDTEKSKQMYKSLVEKEPNNIIALNNYAWLLIEDDKADEAEVFAKRAIAIQPNHPDILDTYGKVLMKLNKYQTAIEQFEQSLQIRPEHPEVLLNYAEALSLTQQPDKARQILASVKSEDPAVISRRAALQDKLR